MSEQLPKHVAIIMDGNGRWAKNRLLPRAAGHTKGFEVANRIVRHAKRRDIEVLSLFTFGMENWRRPDAERNMLFELFLKALTEEIDDLHRNNVRLQVIGERARFPPFLQEKIEDGCEKTKNNDGLTLVIAASYSGQWDITQAVYEIGQKIKDGLLEPEQITAETISQQLSVADLPDPDLFIRTSGEQRISNFYLWQLAYCELYFTPILWPDFDEQEFDSALCHYQKRERRFGFTSEQLMQDSF